MVPTDREALTRRVAELLDGPLDRPGPLRLAGVGSLALGRHDEAARLLERSLALADDRYAVAVHINLGDAHRYQGRLEAAETHYQEALRLAESSAPHMRYSCFQHLGKQRLDQGRTPEARALLESAAGEQAVKDDPAISAATQAVLRLIEDAEAAERAN